MKWNRTAWKTQALQQRLGYVSDDIKISRRYEEEMRRSYRNIDADIVTSIETLEKTSSKIKSRRENSTFKGA